MDSSSEIYNKLDPASDLHVLYGGRQDCPPGHSWKGRRHHALLHHVLRGRGRVRFGRKEWTLGPGDSFLFYPYTDIWYEADSDEPWRYVWVGIGGARLVHYLELCRFRSDEPVIFAKKGRSPGSAFIELLDALEAPSLGQGRRMILVQARLLMLLDALASFDESSPEGKVSRPREETPYVQEILDFLDQAYSRDLSAETIARFAGLERSYCSALFSSTTGTSLMRYLGNLRMEKALELLRGTNLSVRAIAESVGYADPAVFTKRFKRTKGMSPTQARRPGPD
jgi:AraC family transcriptional regulator of arabinose operon